MLRNPPPGGEGHKCFLTLTTLIICYQATFTCSLFLGRIHFRFSNHLEATAGEPAGDSVHERRRRRRISSLFLPEKYSLRRRQAKLGLNMSAFAGHIITCFAEFSRVTRLAFAKKPLVRISNETLCIVQARFVGTNILVKMKA